MSRLDSFIRRMVAQRAAIDFAAHPGTIPDGPIFELGLGNGRTYDHLRQCFPGRHIFVFERHAAAHPDCTPAADFLVLGDIEITLAPWLARTGRRAAFLDSDLGTGLSATDTHLAHRLAPTLARALAPRGLAASDQPLDVAGWKALPPPDGIAAERYFLYRNCSGIMALP